MPETLSMSGGNSCSQVISEDTQCCQASLPTLLSGRDMPSKGIRDDVCDQSSLSSIPDTSKDRPLTSWSQGSKLHASGQCRPCAWFWKPDGCKNGVECCHCHSCPEGEIKSRKKVKHWAMAQGILQPTQIESDGKLSKKQMSRRKERRSVHSDSAGQLAMIGHRSDDDNTPAEPAFRSRYLEPRMLSGMPLPSSHMCDQMLCRSALPPGLVHPALSWSEARYYRHTDNGLSPR